MATTTNYGWTTPDDTALVKDGASAIRTLGSSVDTTLKTQIDAQIAKTIVDAKGDLIAATAADTVSRLAVGTNDQVLMADSTAATGLKWGTIAAGGMTLISTTTLSGTNVNLTSIPSGYKSLYLIVNDAVCNAQGDAIWLRYNNDSGSNYNTLRYQGNASSIGAGSRSDAFYIAETTTYTNVLHKLNIAMEIPNYTSTTGKYSYGSSKWQNDYGNYFWTSAGTYGGTSAISQINLSANTSTWTSGTVRLYGVS